MRYTLKDLAVRLVLTLLLLFFLDIVNTSFLPIMGHGRYIIPFNVLLIIFLGFRIESPYLSLMILFLQYFHSLFTIEGWEMGTIAGVLICLLISYLKEIIHFSTVFMTILVVQLFQAFWFIVVSLLLYLKTDDFSLILGRFWNFLPESIVASLLAPLLFFLLEKIWRTEESGVFKEST